MRGSELLDKMELIDPAYVEEADIRPWRRSRVWGKWAAAAACLCLVAGGALLYRGAFEQGDLALHWTPEWEASDYFQFCGESIGVAGATHSLYSIEGLYAEERVFSDWRETLEEDEVIPVIDSHPLFYCKAYYGDDGRLFGLLLFWQRAGGMECYSDLQVVVGHQELELLEDCVEVDASGNAIEPPVTVTERDGVRIVAEGAENKEKTLTFQNESGWYQISGSFNDAYESVVELLDWFWEHPLDLDRFSLEAGDSYEWVALAECPQAFSQYLPDFAGFGFVETQVLVSLKNGEPVEFDGHYVAHVDESLVKAGTYYDVDGHTTMHWCFKTEPDFYDIQQCVGELSELTESLVVEEVSSERHIAFMWGENCVIVYPSSASEAWALIESLMSR